MKKVPESAIGTLSTAPARAPKIRQYRKIFPQRFFSPAAWFWLMKVVAACVKAATAKYPKYSKFRAAALPAMASDPKPLMAAWINTFETQKNILPLYKNILQEGVALYG